LVVVRGVFAASVGRSWWSVTGRCGHLPDPRTRAFRDFRAAQAHAARWGQVVVGVALVPVPTAGRNEDGHLPHAVGRTSVQTHRRITRGADVQPTTVGGGASNPPGDERPTRPADQRECRAAV